MQGGLLLSMLGMVMDTMKEQTGHEGTDRRGDSRAGEGLPRPGVPRGGGVLRGWKGDERLGEVVFLMVVSGPRTRHLWFFAGGVWVDHQYQ